MYFTQKNSKKIPMTTHRNSMSYPMTTEQIPNYIPFLYILVGIFFPPEAKCGYFL